MKQALLTCITLLCFAFPLMADEGMITVRSDFNVTKTADRLVDALRQKGMTVFDRVHHSEAAAEVGLKLRDTELVIFGNPKIGTLLMQCRQTAAIDLPQKALIWQDEKGRVWLSYNDPQYLKKRHDIQGCDQALQKIGKALATFAKAATK